MLKTKYLSEKAVNQLKNYKYKSGEYSLFDTQLTPFWNWCVELLPLWLAPNLVTLTGFFLVIFGTLQFVVQDLSMTKELNPYCSLISAVCLFLYQTLDAIDGKQARRTGQSGPLGQLFDHGCDAWSTILMVYQPLHILRMFPSPIFFIYALAASSLFYMANWEEYHTQVLRTSMHGFGLTECQWMLIFTFVCNFVFSNGVGNFRMRDLGIFLMPQVDESNIQGKIQTILKQNPDSATIQRVFEKVHSFAEIKLVYLLCFIGCVTTFWGCGENLILVYRKSKHSFIHQLEGLLPLVLMIVYSYVTFKNSDEAWNKPALVVFTIGPFFSLCCSRMIVASVTHSRFTILKDLHLSIPFIIALLMFPLNKHLGLNLNETLVFFGLIGINMCAYFWYIVHAIAQITKELDIYCLTIKHPVKRETKKMA